MSARHGGELQRAARPPLNRLSRCLRAPAAGEKIGSGNYYWAFPSKSFIQLRNRVDALKRAADADNAAAAELQAKLEEISSSAVDGVSSHACGGTTPSSSGVSGRPPG